MAASSFLKSKKMKIVLVAVVAMILIFAGFIIYLNILVSQINTTNYGPTAPLPKVGGSLGYEYLLSYNQGRYLDPYVWVSYNATNSSRLGVNATIYKYPIPKRIYFLNSSNECLDCGNLTTTENALLGALTAYNLTGLVRNTSIVFPQNLETIKNNSILVIFDGLIPSALLNDNASVLVNLLSRHTSIIYVGLNFSNMTVSEAGPLDEIPTAGSLPKFLGYVSKTYTTRKTGFYLNTSTFYLFNSSFYGPTSYVNVLNGSIVIFPNTLSQWPSATKAGKDIAKAIEQLYWLPRYAYGYSQIPITHNYALGGAGVILDYIPINYSTTLPSILDSGYLRIVLASNSSYNTSKSSYYYINKLPAFFSRGILLIPPTIFPNQSNVAITYNITSRPVKSVNISTYFNITNQDLIGALHDVQGPSTHNFSISSSGVSVVHMNLGLGPGNYIILLKNGTDRSVLAAGFFQIPKFNISLIRYNITTGSYIFRVYSQDKAVSNVNYTISLNNQYAATGVIDDGIIAYQLPPHTPVSFGWLNFTINMLSENTYFTAYYSNPPLSVNSEYIEVGLVVVMMLIMVVFVRAPSRDEFYIDVPNLPEEKKTEIKIREDELVSVFDKLNANYHWKYMPLSKAEFRSAISMNIKHNSIPVELTFHNIDSILDVLVVNKKIVGADDLYLPATWITDSKHDINYLATFKKLRIFFVTHSYTFTELDISEEADIVARFKGEKKYFMIYSSTSKFRKVPVYPDGRVYLVFLNSYLLDEFKSKLYGRTSAASERLKMYISADSIRLVDADSIEKDIS